MPAPAEVVATEKRWTWTPPGRVLTAAMGWVSVPPAPKGLWRCTIYADAAINYQFVMGSNTVLPSPAGAAPQLAGGVNHMGALPTGEVTLQVQHPGGGPANRAIFVTYSE